MVEQYAAVFARHGIAKGERVLVHMHNCPSYLFTWFACAKLGAIMVPLNAQAGDFELDFLHRSLRGFGGRDRTRLV